MKKFIISPSIISADFAILGEEVNNVILAGADSIHFDVMDNNYVPNITIGAIVLESLRKYGISVPIDVHFMVKSVDNLIPHFAKAGADCIIFHPETSINLSKSIRLIKNHGCKVGLAFSPYVNIDSVNFIIDQIDIILIMSVNPGFYGQSFIPSTIQKLIQARKMIDLSGANVLLAVDGGVKLNNIKIIARTGVDIFIAGSSIFSQSNYRFVINSMRKELLRLN